MGQKMKILVLNRGSSSIKCSLHRWNKLPEQPVAAVWEKSLHWEGDIPRKKMMSRLKELIAEVGDVDVIGHRIVHGGKAFKGTVKVTSSVKAKIKKLSDLAPLHNIGDVEGMELFKNKPQVAVFDTTFHHTIPDAASVYPGPYAWIKQGIHRYGFHGINYQYCARRCAQLLKQEAKMVICHLGSGASICAVDKGMSVDTTMGFTPLEGLMMDTRSGTIDPGILLHLMKKMGHQRLSKMLYHESGLLGLSGVSSDMKELLGKMELPRVRLALEVYLHRLNASIGAMVASLGGMEALVFTAGIGENSPWVRTRVCENFSFLGIKLDETKNQAAREDGLISSSDSKVQVMVVRANEAFEIARECWRKMHG